MGQTKKIPSNFSYGHVVSSFDEHFKNFPSRKRKLLRSKSKDHSKTTKIFLKKLCLKKLPTHGQAECSVEKTAGNFPINVEIPFYQLSEKKIEDIFLQLFSRNVPPDT